MKCKICGRDNPAAASFCGACGNPLAAAPEPTRTISVGWSYGNAWGLLRKHFLVLLLMVVLLAIAQSVSYLFEIAGRHGGAAGISTILSLAYGILVVGPIGYGLSFACLKAARGDSLEVAYMFAAFRNWGNSILANLAAGIIVAVGLVFLVVPGIIFACKLAFVPYLVVDRRIDSLAAIKQSWRMTTGYAGKIFLIGLLAIPILLAGSICFGVGVIVAIMWVSLAFASLYFAVARAAAQRGEGEGISPSRIVSEGPLGPSL